VGGENVYTRTYGMESTTKKGNQLLTKRTSAVNSNIFFTVFSKCGIPIVFVVSIMKEI